mgnify:CR=1 FL=1
MLISELVAQLEKVKEQEGDLEITTMDDCRNVNTIHSLYVGYDDYRELKDCEEECENEYANKIVVIVS